MDGSVHYSEPGSVSQRTSANSTAESFAPSQLARLFARLINAAIWICAGSLLLAGSLATVGGIAVGEIWPLLNDLPVADLPNADRIIAAALAESFAGYRVSDMILIALFPVAAALLWVLLRVLYLCLLVRFAGGDLGHLAMGLRVVSCRNGERPSFGQALGRAILKQLDLLLVPWLLNGVMVALTRERRHSYDFIVNTVVVAEGWTILPFVKSEPTDMLITDPQLRKNSAIPLPPSRN